MDKQVMNPFISNLRFIEGATRTPWVFHHNTIKSVSFERR